MDWASVAGLVLALAGILVGQALEGGKPSSLLQPAAFAIVVVGTTGAVLLQARMKSFVLGLRMLRWVFAPPPDKRAALARDIMAWSLTARRDGMLALEGYMNSSKDPFITMGLRLIIDGIAPEKIEQLLDTEITAYETEQRLAARIWESAAGYSPTVGILGAVLGLIHVMENLTDPSKLGAGIAVAFVSTIYGVGLANLLFLPVANKLKAIVMEAVQQQEIAAAVFHDIASGESGRVIEERVASLMRER